MNGSTFAKDFLLRELKRHIISQSLSPSYAGRHELCFCVDHAHDRVLCTPDRAESAHTVSTTRKDEPPAHQVVVSLARLPASLVSRRSFLATMLASSHQALLSVKRGVPTSLP